MFDPISLGVSVGGNLVGGLLGSSSAKRAAEQQRQAAQQALGVQRDMYNQQRADWQPYSQLGATGAAQMGSRLNDLTRRFTADDFTKDPGYDFRMNEGRTALEGSAAARGGLFSGAAGKALTKYGQNFASNEYQNAYNRFTNDQNSAFNKLQSLIGTGTQAAGATSAAAGQFGMNAGDLLTGAGNAQAAGTVGAGNAWANAISGGINAYNNNRLTDLVFGGGNLPPRRSAGTGYGNAYDLGGDMN